MNPIRHLPGKLVLAIVVVASLAFSGGCATDKAVISQANDFHQSLSPAVINDKQLDTYVNRLGARVIAAAKDAEKQGVGPKSHFNENSDWMFAKDMQFHFVNSKTLNAFTTGGDHMYIYTELFEQCKSEDELAAVMSHEFAHVYSRHVQKGMNRQYAILGAAAVAGGAGYVAGGSEKGAQYAGTGAGLAMLAGQFVGMSYTRGDESEADQYGFDFYTRAGWDPRHFGDFFQQMIDQGYDKGSEYLSDHPSLKSRVEAANQRAAALPASAKMWRKAPIADASQFKALQKRAAEVGQHMPDDASLAKTQQLLAAMPRSCLTPAIHADQKRAEQAVLAEAQQNREGKQQIEKNKK